MQRHRKSGLKFRSLPAATVALNSSTCARSRRAWGHGCRRRSAVRGGGGRRAPACISVLGLRRANHRKSHPVFGRGRRFRRRGLVSAFDGSTFYRRPVRPHAIDGACQNHSRKTLTISEGVIRMAAKIIAKHTVGSKRTHNGDGKFTRVWRLWSDGRVERTNSRSKYQPMIAGEMVPGEIVAAAEKAGVALGLGRPDWRSLPRTSEALCRHPARRHSAYCRRSRATPRKCRRRRLDPHRLHRSAMLRSRNPRLSLALPAAGARIA